MRVSLRTKLLLLIAGTTSALAAVVLISLAYLTNREINQVLRRDERATEAVLSQLMRERSEAMTDQCRLLARQPVLKAVIGTGDSATVTDSAKDSLPQINAEAAMITDRNGRLLGVTDKSASSHADFRRDPGVSRAIHGVEWSGITTRHGHLVLAVCVPVIVNQSVWGTFSAYRQIDSRIAEELRDDLGTDMAFVVDGKIAGASLPFPAYIAVPSGAPNVIDVMGTKYLALYAPLPNTPDTGHLGFITLRNYSMAAAPYTNLRTTFILVFALALLFTLIAGTIIARGLIRPLDGVVAAAHTLSSGGWPEKFEVNRNDEIGLLQSVFNEMTAAIRDSQEKLLELIDSDPLTGLGNHRRFQERLAEEATRSDSTGEHLTLLLVNIDHFQQYNQQQGHAAGDAALQKFALILQEVHPELAVMARFGGDAFAVLLPQKTLDQAKEFAELLRGAFHDRWKNGTGAAGLSVSIGVAEFGTNTKKADGLLLAAELALSRAKQLGRNMVCGFDSIPGADETADPYQLHRFLKDESLATIQALAAAVDAKDPYTQGHSQRVAQYAAELAQCLGLPKAQVDLIHTTGTLHDVGKIGVPDDILKKPGKLTSEERATMETHPVLGELIVKKVPSLAATLTGVRHHHERWDGTGYPDRLAGKHIPKIARILAYADAFDAMTSDRPYRKGMPVAAALLEVEKGSGTQFDPSMTAYFLEMIRERYKLPKVA